MYVLVTENILGAIAVATVDAKIGPSDIVSIVMSESQLYAVPRYLASATMYSFDRDMGSNACRF